MKASYLYREGDFVAVFDPKTGNLIAPAVKVVSVDRDGIHGEDGETYQEAQLRFSALSEMPNDPIAHKRLVDHLDAVATGLAEQMHTYARANGLQNSHFMDVTAGVVATMIIGMAIPGMEMKSLDSVVETLRRRVGQAVMQGMQPGRAQ